MALSFWHLGHPVPVQEAMEDVPGIGGENPFGAEPRPCCALLMLSALANRLQNLSLRVPPASPIPCWRNSHPAASLAPYTFGAPPAHSALYCGIWVPVCVLLSL